MVDVWWIKCGYGSSEDHGFSLEIHIVVING